MSMRAGFLEIPLSRSFPDSLGVGAFLKNTVCAIKGDRAFLSPVAGDLGTPEAIKAFEEALDYLFSTLDLRPARIAHDLHPDFYSTRWAGMQASPAIAVQHHHAHIAAVAAERRIEEPLIGLALDGFGLGTDRAAWGGELLWVSGPDWRRLGHFAEISQPGGDLAAKEPWRMAASILAKLGRADEIPVRFPDYPAAPHLGRIIDQGINAPLTTSAGRLFDAAAGILGVRHFVNDEAEAPIALEALVASPEPLPQGWRIDEEGALDFTPLMGALFGMEPQRGADVFHGALIAGLVEWAALAAAESGARGVALAGGCFFNRHLREGVISGLAKEGLIPLPPIAISPGDPSISLGQAWIAAQTA